MATVVGRNGPARADPGGGEDSGSVVADSTFGGRRVCGIACFESCGARLRALYADPGGMLPTQRFSAVHGKVSAGEGRVCV